MFFRLLNSVRLGCIRCLRALRFCEERIDIIHFSDYSRLSSKYIVYPDNVEAILSTRVHRQNQLPNVDGRKDYCSKWLMPSFTDITKDSVEGECISMNYGLP